MHTNILIRKVNTLLEYLALILFLFTINANVCAQEHALKFDYITVEQGLTQGQINCVFEDSRGYLWFGTKTGINRFDGNNITIFKNEKEVETSLSGNEITSIAEDKYGILWISTLNNGISLYDWKTDQFERIMHDPKKPSSIVSNSITKVYIDKNNDIILLGTQSSGLDIYDRNTNSFEHLYFDELTSQSISSNVVYDITKEAEGKYWIATDVAGVDLLDISTKTFSHISFNAEQNGVTEDRKKPIYKDSKGFLWVGGSNSANRINTLTKKVTYFEPDNQLNSKMVTSFYENTEGDLWIGTDGGGLNIYDPISNTFEYAKNRSNNDGSLSSNAVYSIYQDRSGIAYVGTYNGGVNTYHPNRYKFNSFKKSSGNENSLSLNFILDFHEASDGKIWIGTDGGGLNLFDPETKNFNHF